MLPRFILQTTPVLAAYGISVLMLRYYAFYDIGINNVANRGFEIYFLLPSMALGLYLVLVFSGCFARGFTLTGLKTFFFKLFSIILVASAILLIRVLNTSDYPTERKQNLTEFLGIAHIIKIDFPKSNRPPL